MLVCGGRVREKVWQSFIFKYYQKLKCSYYYYFRRFYDYEELIPLCQQFLLDILTSPGGKYHILKGTNNAAPVEVSYFADNIDYCYSPWK